MSGNPSDILNRNRLTAVNKALHINTTVVVVVVVVVVLVIIIIIII